MKKIILVLALSAVLLPAANASELHGIIGTYTAPPGGEGGVVDTKPAEGSSSQASGITRKKSKENLASGLVAASSSVADRAYEEVRVLGVWHYPEHSLLRDPAMRIYIIEGAFRKHLRNMAELRPFRGHEIFDVDYPELAPYERRDFIEGDLVRAIGENRIYHFYKGSLSLVPDLATLKKKFLGRSICGVDKAVLETYHKRRADN